MTILEGESLVNDASALVVLRTAVAGLAATSSFSLGRTALEFGWAVIGALVIGGVVGWLTVLLRQRLDDPVLNTTISLVVPFLAYFPAEELHSSGVLAVVVAGLVTGALGSHRFSARDRQTQATTWTTFSFILESGVFLAMGYQVPELIDAAQGETSLGEIALLVLVVLVLLVVLRFGGLAVPALKDRYTDQNEQIRARLDQFEGHLDSMTPADDREDSRIGSARRRLARSRADVEFEEREPITARGFVTMGWAGMRGVVTVAAAQTIPAGASHRATVVLAAFLVALITLVLFGLTLPAVIRRMRFSPVSAKERHDAFRALLRQVGESAVDNLGPLESQTIDGEPIDPKLVAKLKDHILPRVLAGVREAPRFRPAVREQTLILQNRYLDEMRAALVAERSIGAYSSQTYRKVEAVLDDMERRLDLA